MERPDWLLHYVRFVSFIAQGRYDLLSLILNNVQDPHHPHEAPAASPLTSAASESGSIRTLSSSAEGGFDGGSNGSAGAINLSVDRQQQQQQQQQDSRAPPPGPLDTSKLMHQLLGSFSKRWETKHRRKLGILRVSPTSWEYLFLAW